MHNAVGMWFTFLALGVTYYALPKLLNRPIYSYALGVLGFWTNLVFYPIIGAHGGL
jgi:cytochrome c oxidase cbb3-type subunit 1